METVYINIFTVKKIMKLTDGKGVDTAIEAVGTIATIELCEAIVAAGGNLANIGVHGKSVTLHNTFENAAKERTLKVLLTNE